MLIMGVAYDRREAFDYLHRRGNRRPRDGAPLLILLDMKRQRRDGIERCASCALIRCLW